MKRIYLEIVRTIPISFRREWHLENELFKKGEVTWAFEDDYDVLDGGISEEPIVLLEDNVYQTNFLLKFFKEIDEKTYYKKLKEQ